MLNIRSAYGMNIIGITCVDAKQMNMDFTADYVVKDGDHFVVAAKTKKIEEWDYLTRD